MTDFIDPAAQYPVGARIRELATGHEGTVTSSGRGRVRILFDGEDIETELYAESLRDPDGERWVFLTITLKEDS